MIEGPKEHPSAPRPSERLWSIDALRGFDMMWIVGGDRLAHEIGKLIGPPTSEVLDRHLEHAEWEGFLFFDLIFPLFLFLVGTVLPFSLGKLQEREVPRGDVYRRVVRRAVLLFGLGLLCNGVLRLHWGDLRVAGVLQRIAVCYLAAALIYLNSNLIGRAIALAAILAGYWALLSYVPAPETSIAGDLSKEHNLAGYVDRHVLPGKIVKRYYGYGDNEGLLSTVPAIGTVLLGVLAGEWLRSARRPWTKVVGLLGAGGASLAAGLYWGQSFPIIKNLWTSSFVLVAGGWSLILLGAFYAVIDVIGWRAWAFPLVVIGANAITIYVVPRFVDFRQVTEFFLGGVLERSGSYEGLVFAAGFLLFEWLFLLFLYRNRLFLRV